MNVCCERVRPIEWKTDRQTDRHDMGTLKGSRVSVSAKTDVLRPKNISKTSKVFAAITAAIQYEDRIKKYTNDSTLSDELHEHSMSNRAHT